MKNLSIVLTLLSCFAFSCNTKEDNQSIANKTTTPQDNIKTPQTIIIANLPDSLQPKTILLRTKPKPTTIVIPGKTGGSYTSTNTRGEVTKIMLKPPVKNLLPFLQNANGKPIKDSTGNLFMMGTGGISLFTSYTTDDGLSLDNIFSSCMDHYGNLWFGTGGGGVSKYDGKSFANFTTASGLVNNGVITILEDRNGNLWFGTIGGVSKYNGKSFTNYTTASGLADNIVFTIAEDKNGNLWFGTNDGVSKYDPFTAGSGGKAFTNFTTAQGLANNIVYKIVEDKTGNLWFGTRSGVSKYDPVAAGIGGKEFTSITTANGLVNNYVTCITEDKSRNLWFGTVEGVSRYNPVETGNAGPLTKSFTNFTTAQGLANNIVYKIVEDKFDNLWFGTVGGGVSKFDGNSFTNFTTAQGLINNEVQSITEDKTGHLWFGTAGDGISKFEGESFTNFTTDQGLAYHVVLSITEDKIGNLWFGTGAGGVSKYDRKSFTNFTTAQGLSHNYVHDILEDKRGNLWFGTSVGASKYDGKSFTNYTLTQGLANNFVNSIEEDTSGHIWFGTHGGGVSKYDGKSFTNFTTAQGLANTDVYCITEDKAGNLWFGTNGGVSKYDGKSFTNFTTAQGLPNNEVYCITEDKIGNLWFGTNGGGVSRLVVKELEKLRSGLQLSPTDSLKLIFENFTTMEGLSNDFAFNIIQDLQGNIIIGTNHGFTLIPAKVSSLPFSEIRQDIEYYNSSTGYPIKDVNTNALYCDSKGIIWAGTGNKKTALVRFDYAAIQKTSTSPTLIIQKIKVNEENICWFDLKTKGKFLDHKDSSTAILQESMAYGKILNENERDSIHKRFGTIKFDTISSFYPLPQNLVLPYEHNQVTFDFNAIETDKPQLVNYQYILEGYDKAWSPVLKNTTATFGNMKEGSYTFKVKARGVNKVWSEPVSYSFKVLPPLHRSWWAYTIYIGLLGFVGWRLHIFQKKRTILQEREKVQERELVQAKEIKKAYTELGVVHENLKSTQAQLIQSEKMASLGELTAGIAHEIQNPLNFVNNFSDLNKEMLVEMKDEMNKGNIEDAKAIANDVIDNEEKINQHGKRAESIVKGMLQHSRKSTGVKEPTNINALADEYMRLSYHGLRAKDKSFNAEFKMDLDPTLPLVNVIPQDLGRVLLNLFNNAFWAVSKRQGVSSHEVIHPEETHPVLDAYQPIVTLSTKNLNDLIEIRILDNGPGIPPHIIDKIFQPFFTTKPTGQGTGLGLSLAYDIIKAHGGELKVLSVEGQGAEFIIKIPRN